MSPIPTPEQMSSVSPAATAPELLRNFSIIAHIDHGKSTLADRMLQATGVVQPRDMRAQYLDRMDIERERGITIKSQAVRMPWAVQGPDGTLRTYALNMIDTPGHVDFSYEVNRSRPSAGLGAGEVGYLITGVKDVRQSKVGDTVTNMAKPATDAIGGYKDPKPMVFSGLYPIDGSDYPNLRDALDKLKLNDAALSYEPETSAALGFGFRCGFLGLLHLEIIRERLEREFNLDIISTAPSVVYEVTMEDRTTHTVTNPSEFPEGKVSTVSEPVVRATILTPSEFVGTVMELCQSRRGTMAGMDYLSETRVEMHYTLPLAEIVFDFFDALKSRTRGYASLDYEMDGSQEANLVKVDILLNGERVDAFSAIVHRDAAYSYGVMMTTTCPRRAWRCTTRCRWPRSSSTSSTP